MANYQELPKSQKSPRSQMGAAGVGMDGMTWQDATSTTSRRCTAMGREKRHCTSNDSDITDHSTLDNWRERHNAKRIVVRRNGKKQLPVSLAPRIIHAEPSKEDKWLNSIPEEFKHLIKEH